MHLMHATSPHHVAVIFRLLRGTREARAFSFYSFRTPQHGKLLRVACLRYAHRACKNTWTPLKKGSARGTHAYRLEKSRAAHRARRAAGHQHSADAGHDSSGSHPHAKVGAQKLWAGTVVVQPDAKTGPHHHGELETVIYVVKGRAKFRWGERLEFVDEAGPGDFVYVPPYVPHQELNARSDEPVEAVVVRSGQEPVVVNLDISTPDPAPTTPQPDPFHTS